jgi:hypothetical protein
MADSDLQDYIVVPLERFLELRHDGTLPHIAELFASISVKARPPARAAPHARSARPQMMRTVLKDNGWRKPPAPGKRPLKAATDDRAAAQEREVVSLCNKLAKANYGRIADKLMAYAEAGEAMFVAGELLAQSARRGSFNGLYTSLLGKLALTHPQAVASQVASSGDTFVAGGSHLLADACWTDDYDGFCRFIAARAQRHSLFESLCLMGYVEPLAHAIEDARERIVRPDCEYCKDMMADMMFTYCKFNRGSRRATIATFAECLQSPAELGIHSKTRFAIMDLQEHLRRGTAPKRT